MVCVQDMTGSQLAHVVDPDLLGAAYSWVLEGCPHAPVWSDLSFEVEAPVGSSVSFAVRTAEGAEQLETASFVPVCSALESPSPCSIADSVSATGQTPRSALEVEIRLNPSSAGAPVIREVGVN